MAPRTRIRLLTAFFVAALVVSGLTAFPVLTELRALEPLFAAGSALDGVWPAMAAWLREVHGAYEVTYRDHPYIGYGTDWLAFAHLVIGMAFLGVWRDPARNVWVVEWAMLACIGIWPLAILCGPIRGIPWFWTLVDCSFGVFGLPVLWWLRHEILMLDAAESSPRGAPRPV